MSTTEREDAMHQPYIIQRATIAPAFGQASTVTDAVKLDYMGYAEFEFGALPSSLQRMFARFQESGHRALQALPLANPAGEPLLAYGLSKVVDALRYGAQLAAIERGELRTKCSPRIVESLTPRPLRVYKDVKPGENRFDVNPIDADYYPRQAKTKAQRLAYAKRHDEERTDFWWDLDNDVMFSAQRDFMEALPGILEGSWRKMLLLLPLDGPPVEVIHKSEAPRP